MEAEAGAIVSTEPLTLVASAKDPATRVAFQFTVAFPGVRLHLANAEEEFPKTDVRRS